MRSVSLLLAALLFPGVVGCGDGHTELGTVGFADLEDDAFVGGDEVVRLEIDSELKVVRTELYLDGARVAEDDLAPFELAWDTRLWLEGPHTLSALAHLAGGDIVEAALSVTIDNTPPEYVGVSGNMAFGARFAIVANDNLGVDRVELYRDGAGPVAVEEEPFELAWPWHCDQFQLEVRVMDHAGNAISAFLDASSSDPDDFDCDGHQSVEAGGDDCDDFNEYYHPNAEDTRGDGFDHNCDGRD
jgi:hypothetical protein